MQIEKATFLKCYVTCMDKVVIITHVFQSQNILSHLTQNTMGFQQVVLSWRPCKTKLREISKQVLETFIISGKLIKGLCCRKKVDDNNMTDLYSVTA